MDQYGVAFVVRADEEPTYNTNFPQVVAVPTESETISLSKEMKKYCRHVTPFRNPMRRKQVNWRYIKENEITSL